LVSGKGTTDPQAATAAQKERFLVFHASTARTTLLMIWGGGLLKKNLVLASNIARHCRNLFRA
jgi:hypothetical protein